MLSNEKPISHTDLILLSNSNLPSIKHGAKQLGFAAHLPKPIERSALLNCFSKLTELRARTESISKKEQAPISIERIIEKYGADALPTFVKLFLEGTPPQIDEMRLALESASFEKLGKLAHGLKGVSASIFAAELKSLCTSLEQAAKAEETASASSCFAKLEDEFSRINQFLKQQNIAL